MQEMLTEKASVKLLAPDLSLGQPDMGCGCHTCCGSLRLPGASAAHFLPQNSLPGFPSTSDGNTHLPYGETTPAPSESALETACGVGNIAPNPIAADPLCLGRQGAGRARPHPLAASDAPC